MKFIYDSNLINKTVEASGYDTKKVPLGQLSDETIKNGYLMLKKIELVLKIKMPKDQKESSLAELSSRFYTYIPHNFGRQKMSNFIINSFPDLNKKLELLQNLDDSKTAIKIQNDTNAKIEKQDDKQEKSNPLDENYKRLNTNINVIHESEDVFKTVNEYIQNSSSGYGLKLLDCFEIDREGEKDRFNPNKLGNKKLLFHGSGFSNFVGILSTGLRIAPPEAPCHGYLFGKGIYLADQAGKSAPYCSPHSSNNTILMLLCETACGTPQVLLRPDSNAATLPAGTHSTFCSGQLQPDPNGAKKIEDIELPMGKPTTLNDKYMGHNEYIVYSVAQVKLRYLVRLKVL